MTKIWAGPSPPPCFGGRTISFLVKFESSILFILVAYFGHLGYCNPHLMNKKEDLGLKVPKKGTSKKKTQNTKKWPYMPQVYIKRNFQIWPKTKLSSLQSTVGGGGVKDVLNNVKKLHNLSIGTSPIGQCDPRIPKGLWSLWGLWGPRELWKNGIHEFQGI